MDCSSGRPVVLLHLEGTDDDGETDEDHEDEPELPLEPIDKDQFTLILQWVTIGLTGALCLY